MNKCYHELVRFLDCEEHGKDCELVICCNCGEAIEDFDVSKQILV